MAKKIDYTSMYTLRKDGRYQGYWRDTNGIRHALCDRDPEKLYQKLLEKEAPEEEKPITFKQVAEAWEREHREQIEVRTWKNYAPHMKTIYDLHGDKPFSEVTAMDVKAHLARAKAQDRSATVVRSIRSLYNMIFDYAVVNGYAPYNPIGSVKLPKGLKQSTRSAPTDEQMKIILNSLDKPFGLFPFLLLCTGLRKSEALALLWEDIDLENKEIHVTKSLDTTVGSKPTYKAPKTEAGTRDVPIINILLKPLKDAKKASSNPLVFPCPSSNRAGEGGGLVTDRAYDGLWTRYCEATGLVTDTGKPAITAHQLRHGTATLMYENNVDTKTAQAVLGHSREEITREIYTDLRAKQKVKSIAKLNRGMAKLMATKKSTDK